MEKLRLSRIMARAADDELAPIAQWVEERHPTTVLKEPAATLVMLPMRDPSRGTPFYIGELLATEAMVELGGARGIGVCMGENTHKAMAMAVIDAAYNARLEDCAWLTGKLESLERRQAEKLATEAALHASTRVTFNTMEGNP